VPLQLTFAEGTVGDVEEGGGETGVEAPLDEDSAYFEDAVGRIQIVQDGERPKVAAEVEGPGANYKNRAKQQIEPQENLGAVAAEPLAKAGLPQAEAGGDASEEEINE